MHISHSGGVEAETKLYGNGIIENYAIVKLNEVKCNRTHVNVVIERA